MIKRTLFFSSPASLRLKDCQIVISLHDSSDSERTIPIEDIGIVLIENPQTSISIPLLNALSEANVAVIFCNDKHMPQSMLYNFETNNTLGESLRLQISLSEAKRKRLWKQIVEHKIRNQARLLDKLHGNGLILKPYYSNVLSGDSDNREGIAARIYWKALFGDDYVRDRSEEGINSLLNYGYAILRAATTRAIMGSGLMPSLGLFHHNRSNGFPLADDLMEPYRPFVDEAVYELCEEGMIVLNKTVKSRMLSILTCDTHFKNMVRPLQISLSTSTSSFGKYLSGESTELSFPWLE